MRHRLTHPEVHLIAAFEYLRRQPADNDIVYLAADVEDAVKKSVLSWNEVDEKLKDEDADSVRGALELQERILKAGRPSVPVDIDDDIRAAAFSAAISVMVAGAFQEFQAQYDEIMNGTYQHALLPQSDAKELATCLRRLGEKRVYPTRSTLTLELMGRQVIGDLMDVFWEGAEAMPRTGAPETFTFAGKAAALISPNYRQVFQHSLAEERTLPKQYHQFQLVTDYVCGMTDSFAKRLHAELFNGR